MAEGRRRSPVVLIVLLLMLAGAATWRVVTTRAGVQEASETVRGQLAEIISANRIYGESAEYIDSLLQWAHARVFDEHYQIGLLFVRPRFDHARYVDDVFALMVDQARQDGAVHVAEALRTIGVDVEVSPP